jgi:type III secretory pathway component EscS
MLKVIFPFLMRIVLATFLVPVIGILVVGVLVTFNKELYDILEDTYEFFISLYKFDKRR